MASKRFTKEELDQMSKDIYLNTCRLEGIGQREGKGMVRDILFNLKISEEKLSTYLGISMKTLTKFKTIKECELNMSQAGKNLVQFWGLVLSLECYNQNQSKYNLCVKDKLNILLDETVCFGRSPEITIFDVARVYGVVNKELIEIAIEKYFEKG